MVMIYANNNSKYTRTAKTSISRKSLWNLMLEHIQHVQKYNLYHWENNFWKIIIILVKITILSYNANTDC